jgi:hypothetical protein
MRQTARSWEREHRRSLKEGGPPLPGAGPRRDWMEAAGRVDSCSMELHR